jgi:two-component system heavy metal sensor histidine kinase CusS
LKREVQRQEITEVAGKLELINHLIGMQTTLAQMQDLRSALDNIMVGHGNLKTWITLADGSVFYGEAPPVDVRPLSGREIRLHSQDGWNMRGLRVPLEGTLLPGAELTVAVNLRPGTQFLYAFATALVLICATWVGATLVLSAWAVRRSLSPIRRLSQQAARIQPDNLAVRLPEQGIDRELREFTHTFNGMLGRVQTAYQQMEGFNADVAHELRTPLATLISGAEVILSSSRSEQELREVLESNLEELEGLKALVNDMLFLARADGGEPAGDLQEVDVRREVARVAEYYEAALDEAGVSLTAHGAAILMANPRLLRRAIANLLSNAIRATPRGRAIDLYCITRQEEIEIRVRNPGAPIASEALPRIFDRFYRGDDARSRRADGHGLGLAIVRAIARMHGGNAFARCGGQGTEVGFTLSRTPNITGK